MGRTLSLSQGLKTVDRLRMIFFPIVDYLWSALLRSLSCLLPYRLGWQLEFARRGSEVLSVSGDAKFYVDMVLYRLSRARERGPLNDLLNFIFPLVLVCTE